MMRNCAGRIVSLFFALMIAGSLGAYADPLESTSPEPVLPDPSPDNGVNFPPASATRDVARPSAELSSDKSLGGHACSALNPCAAPTLALGDANVPGVAQTGMPKD
jgi:hypothetical protein